ncbi:MAG: hypothetical protein IT307_14425 [Chloroflexi bacterium]|nr:hypothetical protein [Chloroflexota bacterium]
MLTGGLAAALAPGEKGDTQGLLASDVAVGSRTTLPPAVTGPVQNLRARFTPATAFDGTNWLVAWVDRREWQELSLMVSRVSPTPAPLDPFGIRLPASRPATPAVAFGDGIYLVAWSEGDYSTEDIVAVRVAPDGKVLDTAPRMVAKAAGVQAGPAVAFGGGTFYVAWRDGRTPGADKIYGTRVSPQGDVADSLGTQIGDAGGGAGDDPAVAWDGSAFRVLYMGGNGLNRPRYVRRVAPSGGLLGQPKVIAGDEVSRAHGLACKGDGTCFVTQTRNNGGELDLEGQELDGSDSSSFGNFVISAEAGDQVYSPVAATPTGWLTAWVDSRADPPSSAGDVYAARVPSGATAPMDPKGIALDIVPQKAYGLQRGISSAHGADRTLVAMARQSFPWDIYARAVLDSGSPTQAGATLVAASGAEQYRPCLSCEENTCWLLFTEATVADSMDVRAVEVDAPSGKPKGPSVLVVGGPPFQRGEACSVGAVTRGAATSASGGYAVSAVSPAGVPMGPGMTTVGMPAVAATPSGHFFATTSTEVGHVGKDGQGVVFVAPLTPSSASVEHVAAAYDGQKSLVVWSDGRNGNTTRDIYGRRFATDGAAEPEFVISAGAWDKTKPSVACIPNKGCLVVWADGKTPTPTVAYALVSAGSVSSARRALPEALLVGTGIDELRRLSVGTDGVGFLAAWSTPDARSRVRGAFFDGGGTLQGLTDVSDGKEVAMFPSASGANGDWVVAYQQFDADPAYMAMRVKLAALRGVSPGGACSSPGQCTSGVCAGGLCQNAVLGAAGSGGAAGAGGTAAGSAGAGGGGSAGSGGTQAGGAAGSGGTGKGGASQAGQAGQAGSGVSAGASGTSGGSGGAGGEPGGSGSAGIAQSAGTAGTAGRAGSGLVGGGGGSGAPSAPGATNVAVNNSGCVCGVAGDADSDGRRAALAAGALVMAALRARRRQRSSERGAR